jgi:hypothetical protein
MHVRGLRDFQLGAKISEKLPLSSMIMMTRILGCAARRTDRCDGETSH